MVCDNTRSCSVQMGKAHRPLWGSCGQCLQGPLPALCRGLGFPEGKAHRDPPEDAFPAPGVVASMMAGLWQGRVTESGDLGVPRCQGLVWAGSLEAQQGTRLPVETLMNLLLGCRSPAAGHRLPGQSASAPPHLAACPRVPQWGQDSEASVWTAQ